MSRLGASLVLLLWATSTSIAAESRVVLISIDGLAAYHLLDDELELPNLRRLMREGAWASSSETVFPSVTHPSHTTMVTGVEPRTHGVLSNRLQNRETGENFHPTNKPRTEIVQVPTIFDFAKAAGLGTAAFFWPETLDDPSIDFNIPEVFTADGGADRTGTAPESLEELRRAGIPIDLYFDWYGSTRHGAADTVLADAAAHVLRTRRPHLLALHILVADKAQHSYGPHHYQAHAALATADDCVGRILAAVDDDEDLRETTSVIVAADHGFHSVRHEVDVLPVFSRWGLAEKKVALHGGGWALWVEKLEGFEPTADGERLESVFAELSALPWVARIAGPSEMHDLGQPRFEESPYARGHYVVIPDIDTFLVAESTESAVELRPRPPAHTHGYLPDHPRMYPALILWGADIRSGARLGHTHNLSIAPTIAALLDLQIPNVHGEALLEAIDR